MEMDGGGTTLSETHRTARKLLMEAREGMGRLERLDCTNSNSPIDSPDLAFAVEKYISQLQSLCADMERLWRSIPARSQRDLWKRKVEQVSEEAESLRGSLANYSSRNRKRMTEAKERAELLGRANGDSAHVLTIFDEEAQAMKSVRNSKTMLEESLSTGVAILSKYSEQRDTLKRAQRKALDVLNTVGLSNSVLRLIERRNRVDTWIKFIGFVLTLVVLYFCLKWTR